MSAFGSDIRRWFKTAPDKEPVVLQRQAVDHSCVSSADSTALATPTPPEEAFVDPQSYVPPEQPPYPPNYVTCPCSTGQTDYHRDPQTYAAYPPQMSYPMPHVFL